MSEKISARRRLFVRRPKRVRAEDVVSITDQEILAELSLTGSWEVRLEAIGRLTDQEALAEAARQAQDWCVCAAAVDRVSDESLLVGILQTPVGGHTEHLFLHWEAANKLTDQVLIAEVALHGQSSTGRDMAISKLTDQALLETIAMNTEESEARYRRTAVEQLTDQTLLTRLAGDDDESVRHAAVKHLSDQKVLSSVAQNDQGARVRLAAIKRLTDQTLLTSIAKGDNKDYLCQVAAERLVQVQTLAVEALAAEKPPMSSLDSPAEVGPSASVGPVSKESEIDISPE